MQNSEVLSLFETVLSLSLEFTNYEWLEILEFTKELYETSWDSWRIIWKTIQGKCHGGFEKDKLSLNIISNISILFRTDNTNIIHVTI